MRLARIVEASREIGIQASTFRGWCREGIGGSFPPARRIGGRWFIDLDRLSGWLDRVGIKAGAGRAVEDPSIRAFIDAIIRRNEG